jgi:flagellar assembly protein FliH
MKSYKAITFTTPLRDVCLAATSSRVETETRLREAEDAAYERGRRDGEKALSEQLLQQRSEILELQQGVFNSIRTAVPKLVQEAETVLIDLAMEAARKVVANIPISPEIVEAVTREAIGQIEDKTAITIHLHPDDLALLRKHQSPILQGLPETGPLKFIGASDVSRGGCVIHTRFGLLDARRETKVEQLRKSLTA